MKWTKRTMSRTEAQQQTGGRKVPYLRFIKARNPQNNQTWFRQTLFAQEKWGADFFGQHAVESCQIDVKVSIAGNSQGTRQMTVTHDDNRMMNNSTPNTWLHFDNATRTYLENHNREGQPVTFQNLGNGYELIIG